MQQNTQFSQGLPQNPPLRTQLSQERSSYGRATEEEIVTNAPLGGGAQYLVGNEPITTTNLNPNLGSNFSGSQGYTQPGAFASTGDMYVPGPSTKDFGQFTQPGLISGPGTNLGQFSQPGLITGTGTSFEPVTNLGQFSQPGLITGTGTGFETSTNFGQFSQPGFIAGTGAGLGTGLGLATGTQGLTQPTMTQPLVGTGTDPVTTTGLTTTGLATEGLIQTASTARGTFIFRPIEGRFIKNQDHIGLMDPYCKIKIGLHRGKTSVAKSEGTHPVWNDVISIEKKHNEKFAKIKVKDHDKLTLNDKIGEAKIPLGEIAAKGRVNQWFPVYKKDQMTGEVLMDITFQPRGATAI